MEIIIKSNEKLTDVDGVRCRVWEGVAAAGVKCFVFVHRVAVHRDENAAEFDRELKETAQPGRDRVFDLRHIL